MENEQHTPPAPPPFDDVGSGNNYQDNRKSFFGMASVAHAFNRFPLTFLSALLMLFVLEIAVITGDFNPGVITGCSLALNLTLAVYLLAEMFNWERKNLNIYQGIAIAVSVVFGVIMGLSSEADGWLVKSTLSLQAVSAAIILFPPLRGRIEGWRFSWTQIISALVCAIISFLIGIASGVLNYAAKSLLGMSPEVLTMILSVLFLLSVNLLILLCRTPDIGESELSRPDKSEKFLSIVGLYVFAPLLGLFMVILLSYLLILLSQMTIPRGTIGWSVTFWVCAVYCVMYALYPSHSRLPRWFKIVINKGLPAASIAFLVLMDLALIYRIMDYGLTPSRVYGLIFTLCGYGIFGKMLWNGIKKIWIVPAVYASAFFLTSFFPIANITELCKMTGRISDEYQLQEMNPDETDSDTYNKEEAEDMTDGADTILNAQTAPVIPDDTDSPDDTDHSEAMPPRKGYDSVDEFDHNTIILMSPPDLPVSIPAKADYVRGFSVSDYKYGAVDEHYVIDIQGYKAEIPVDSLCRLDGVARLKPFEIKCINSRDATMSIFFVEIIQKINASGEVTGVRVSSLNGYLFTRKKYIHKK